MYTFNYIKVALLFWFLSFQTMAQKNINIGTSYKLQSKILKEERSYTIGLPDNYYKSSKKYPIMVLLDGGFRFHSHSGIINHMVNARQVPEMIIIGINNIDRVRDFTPTNYLINLNGSDGSVNQKTSGGSSNFLRFIEEELLPTIKKNYRTNSFKTLVGISHGGLLVASSYLSNNTSFDAYISMDPSFWWDNQYIVKQIDSTNFKQIKHKKFYLSTADKYENFKKIPHVFKANINSHVLFNAKIKNKGVTPSNFHFDYFKEENHWSVALLSLYKGMKFIYKDLYMDNFYTNSYDKIVAHYKNNYNGKFFPSERSINNLGYRYLKTKARENEALKLFLLNTKNYPNSSNAFDSLGEAYMLLEKPKKAIKNFKISLKLDPSNENAKKMIHKIQLEN
ncbi:alpha/beta hydrolase-fold protein [Tenacibaculum sp.]|nr:alpha/beta hydrolase-fold protein [Tenacibaculum sp.]